MLAKSLVTADLNYAGGKIKGTNLQRDEISPSQFLLFRKYLISLNICFLSVRKKVTFSCVEQALKLGHMEVYLLTAIQL